MTDELLLTLADMADISPKKVRLIITAYEKAKMGGKPVPEGYTAFEYEGRPYAYKSLGDGPWTPECASVELMRILRNYFIRSGKMVDKMKEGRYYWPGSNYNWAWTGNVYSNGRHGWLYSSGDTDYDYDYVDCSSARFAVLPL